MAENIGNPSASVIIDTSSVDRAVQSVTTAATRLTTLLGIIDNAIGKTGQQGTNELVRMGQVQANLLKQQAANTIANAKLITAQTKAESEKRIQQAQEEANRVKQIKESQANSGLGAVDRWARQQRQNAAPRQMFAQQAAEAQAAAQREQQARNQVVNSAIAGAAQLTEREQRLQQIRIGNLQEYQGAARRASEAEQQARNRVVNDAMAGAAKMIQADENLSRIRLQNLRQYQEAAKRLTEPAKITESTPQQIRQGATGAQSAINAASAELAALKNQIDQLRSVAPETIDLSGLQAQFSEARQPVVNLQAELARLKSELVDIATTPQRRNEIVNEMNRIREAAKSAATAGLNPLRNALHTTQQTVERATTGLRGYFNELRKGLNDLNRMSLGKNLQELTFRMMPFGIASGAAVARGGGVAMELEESRLSLEGFTGSQQEAVVLMDELREGAQKFGLPVLETLTTMQRFVPLLRQANVGIEDAINLAARLASLNPMQGIEGALFAINEALAGQWRSLQFRFNLSTKGLQDSIRDMGFVEGFDAYLDTLGRTTELAERFGETTRAAFTRARDAIDLFLATAIRPVLDGISPVIEGFTNLLNTASGLGSFFTSAIGWTLAFTAALVPLGFALSNVALAVELLGKLKLAQLLGAVGAGIGTAFTAGGLAGLSTFISGMLTTTIAGITAAVSGAISAVISVLAALLPILGPIALVLGALYVVFDQLNRSAQAATEDALRPFVDEMERLASIGEKAISSVPGAAPLGSTADEYDRATQALNGYMGELIKFNDEIDNTVGPQLNAIRLRVVESMRSDPITTGITFRRFDVFKDLPETVDQMLDDMEAAINEDRLKDAVGILARLPEDLQNELVSGFSAIGDPATSGVFRALLESQIAAWEDVDAAVAERYENLGLTAENRAKQIAAENQFQTAVHMFVIADQNMENFQSAILDFAEVFPELTEEFSGFADSFAKDTERIKNMRDDFERQTQRTGEDRALRDSRELFDFIAQQAQAVNDFARQQAQELEDYLRDRQRAIDDFYQELAEMDDENREREKKQLEDYNKQIARMQEDHLRDMVRMARDVDDAISARDFLAAQKALQRMADAEEDFQVELRRRQEDFDEQMEQLEDELEKQKKERQKDFERQLKDMDENFARQRQRQQDDFNRQLQREAEQRALRLQRQMQDDAIADQRRREDYDRQVQELISHNALIQFLWKYGLDGMAAELSHFFNQLAIPTPQTQAGTGTFGNIGAGIGGVVGGIIGALQTPQQQGQAALDSFYDSYRRGVVGYFADGVWNVPHDMWARIHKGESVVPAPITQSVTRGDFAIGAGGNSGAFVFSPQVNVTVNGSDQDRRQLAELIKEEIIDGLAGELKRVRQEVRGP